MKITWSSIILPLLIHSSINCESQPVRNLKIYLVIGQSNMAGRAAIETNDTDTLKNVFLFRGDSLRTWEPAANPLNRYSTIRKDLNIQKMGPAYHFARLIHDVSPRKAIGLVVNCRGGTSIKEWMPGTKYFSEAVSRAKLASQYGNIEGIIWHQGESDVNNPDEYMERLIRLIWSLRKQLGDNDLPFVAGQLSSDREERNMFNEIILTLPSRTKNTDVVSSSGLTTIDSTHFDSRSVRILGERYAVAMNRLTSGAPARKIKRMILCDETGF